MSKKLWIAVGAVVGLAALLPLAGWLSLTHQPSYYRRMMSQSISHDQLEQQAKRFVAQSLQFHNDIRNEPTWEAVFSDQEVNAWLAEDLVTHFADQLPPEVRDPRVLFEMDRVILAFRLERSGVDSVITVVARARIPSDNTVELTLEKIRAGILPVPADGVLDRITEIGRRHGVDVLWKKVEGYPVVQLQYQPNLAREDVRLEDVEIRSGRIRLAGRSDRNKGAFLAPRLPSRRILQLTFPKENFQFLGGASSRSERSLRRTTSPTS